MKLIVISHPEEVKNEAEIIELLTEDGLQYFHLRKPEWNISVTRKFLSSLPDNVLPHIVLHDNYELSDEFNIAGCHRNFRNKDNKSGNKFSISCHSISEIKEWSHEIESYLFLSPIYDSISKAGYKKGFSNETLIEASSKNIINDKVIALGGITLSRVKDIAMLGFGGVAVLGSIWQEYLCDNDIDALIDRFLKIKNETDKY